MATLFSMYFLGELMLTCWRSLYMIVIVNVFVCVGKQISQWLGKSKDVIKSTWWRNFEGHETWSVLCPRGLWSINAMLYLVVQAYSSKTECQIPPLITWLKPSKILFQVKLIRFGEVREKEEMNLVWKQYLWACSGICHEVVSRCIQFWERHGRKVEACRPQKSRERLWVGSDQARSPGRFISPGFYPLDYQKSCIYYTVLVFSHE